MPDDAPLPGWPRGLREDLAAKYVGLSVSTLRTVSGAEDGPKPVSLTAGRKVYLKEDLDAWLDRRAGRAAASEGSNPWLT